MNEEQIAQLIKMLIDSLVVQDENEAMQVIQMAEQGDTKARQLIQQVVLAQMQGTVSAKLGAKLNYLLKLKKICPEGQELVYMKVGGKVCKVCQGKKMQPGGYIPGPITKDNPSSKYQLKPKPKTTVNKPKEKSEYDRNGRYIGINPNLRGKTRKEIEAMLKKNRQQATRGVGEGAPVHAKGGMLINKGTAFGDGTRGANPRNTDRGGHRSHGNTRAASYLKKTNVPNKFTAFGDTGKYKPINVGLVGHRATGLVAKMLSKYTTSDNVNKHTAFGAHINRSHRGSAACPSTRGWKKIKGAPRGGSGQTMGWKKYANGGTFVNFFQDGGNVSKYRFADDQFGILDDAGNFYSKDVYSNKWFVVPPGKGRWEFRPMTWVEDDNVMNELGNLFNTRYKTRADKYDYGEKLTRGADGKYYHSDGKPVGRYWYSPIDTPTSTPTQEKTHINEPKQGSWGAESSDYTDRYFGKYANGGSLTALFFENFIQRDNGLNSLPGKYQNGGAVSFYQDGTTEGGIGDAALDLVPVYGTYRIGKRFFLNPSFGGAVNFVTSALGDAAMLTGIGAGPGLALKTVGTAGKAGKVVRAVNNTRRIVGTGAAAERTMMAANKRTSGQKLAEERAEDKAMGVNKKVKTQHKYDKAYVNDDARSVNSGYSRSLRESRKKSEELINSAPKHIRDRWKQLIRRSVKPNANKQQINQERNALLDEYTEIRKSGLINN